MYISHRQSFHYVFLFFFLFYLIHLMTNFYGSCSTPALRKQTLFDGQQNQSKYLFDEVVRKNQQIMKVMLSKMTQIYTRQQEYEGTINSISDKLKEITDNNCNIHHEMRSGHLEMQKKHQVLINDIKGLKSNMKMPPQNCSNDEYLSSKFFQEHASNINPRIRKRNKTNFLHQKDRNKQQGLEELTASHRLTHHRLGSVANLADKFQKFQKEGSKQNDKVSIRNELNRISKNLKGSEDIEEIVKNQLLELNEDIQNDIHQVKTQIEDKNQQTNLRIIEFKLQLEAKMQKMSKEIVKEDKWGQVDFEELHNYLDNKVEERLAEMVDRKFMKESMINLKDAFEEELRIIYRVADNKLSRVDLFPIQDKINQLVSQVEACGNLNSIKIQNLSYSTCKSTPFKHKYTRSSIIQNEDSSKQIVKQSQDSKFKPNQLKYCNSMSVLNRGQQNDAYKIVEQLSQKKWKKKAIQTLGFNKIKRQKQVQ